MLAEKKKQDNDELISKKEALKKEREILACVEAEKKV